MYNPTIVKPISSFTYSDDSEDLFHREPYCVQFQVIGNEQKLDFTIINIHTDPDEATQEIKALPLVVEAVERLTGEQEIIILGDFNSDCSYFSVETFDDIFKTTNYLNVIGNDFDTTVSNTVCTYDRIVITDDLRKHFKGFCGMIRFDQVYNLTQDEAKKISDHYPVWIELEW